MRLEAESRAQRLFGWLAGFPFALGLVALLLGATGILFIHSATLTAAEFAGQDKKQAVALIALGLVALPLAYVPRSRLLRLAAPIYAVALVTLALIPVFGVTINGAKRWFAFGSMTIQPTELMKPALIVVLAWWLRFKSRAGLTDSVGVPVALTMLPIAFMLRQPDLGSALSLLPVMLAMCYAGGARPKTLLLIVLAGAVCLVVAFPFLHDYQKERIVVWLSQNDMDTAQRTGAGYHLRQSLIAVGAGGFTGSGLFHGPQNVYDFLPYRSTDFLFAVVAEETGFVGATLCVAVYTGFSLMILGVASRIRDRFGRLLATGVAVMFATHLGIHVGVCTGLLPPTGLPLPLLSYGRSSLAGAWLALALVAHAVVGRERDLSEDMYL